ncbi:MAG: IS630 transposase-related protein [Prevotella sp.]|nr:IS630 transposase-related protein [Prevotella sp.]
MSIEIRQKVIKAHKRGISVVDICRIMDLKPAAVYDLIRLEKNTGDITPKTFKCGRKPALTAEQLGELELLIKANPDITLEEMKEELGLQISIGAISCYVRNKLGFNYKKKVYTPANRGGRM